MEISRSAVARIRTEGHAKPAKIPCKQKLLDTAKLAETIVKERSDKRQLWLNFDTEPELKQKAEECATGIHTLYLCVCRILESYQVVELFFFCLDT